MRRKPWIWTRIFRLEQDFKEKGAEVETLQRLVNEPKEEDWGIMPEIRKLRELIEKGGD